MNLIKKDERVEVVATAQPDKKYGATITRLGAEIGRTRSLIVEATLDKGADLVPGMFTEAHIQVGQTNRVVLPADAVIKRGKTWHAFVVKNGELEERLVQLGATPGENQVSIVQGVAKGEKVATKLDAKIVDGLKVVE